MGAFFTNVQLKTSDPDKTELRVKIAECIIKLNTEAGLVKVENEEEADKTVIICVSEDSNWISIYDEETEDQGSRKLNKLSSTLSREFKTTALSVLVNDSDAMYVGLHANGVLKDSLSNLSNAIDFNKSKPKAWNGILLGNYSFENIKTAWQNKSVFVEEFLTALATFIKLDTSKLLTGYNYMDEDHPNEGLKLSFAQKDKKNTAPLGLTKFSMVAGAGLIDVKEGEKQSLDWILTNYGLSSEGVDVVIAGECIDRGLLIPEHVQTTYIKSQRDNHKNFTTPFVETVATTGEKLFVARIEELYVPKGFQPSYPMSTKEAKRYLKISYDCAIKFSISFMGGKEGGGNLDIFSSPTVNRQEGSHYTSVTKGNLDEWMKKRGIL